MSLNAVIMCTRHLRRLSAGDRVLPAFSLGLFLCIVGLFIILDASRLSLYALLPSSQCVNKHVQSFDL